MTLEVAVDRRRFEVDETVLVGAIVKLSGKEHHEHVAAELGVRPAEHN